MAQQKIVGKSAESVFHLIWRRSCWLAWFQLLDNILADDQIQVRTASIRLHRSVSGRTMERRHPAQIEQIAFDILSRITPACSGGAAAPLGEEGKKGIERRPQRCLCIEKGTLPRTFRLTSFSKPCCVTPSWREPRQPQTP
ncbi:hypothetical protein [Caballeronia hypogeia]|uniref:hypothetical protein n=1 Tax=Caballeronia hypogeia TaxID=1777140 RepID=UPI0018DF0E2E|nr:hypothetical protein [Caballeronia hypogeia]